MRLSVLIPVFNEEKTVLHVIEHVRRCGVPHLDDAGRPTLGAGLGRPLILTTLEREEAMRVLAEQGVTPGFVAGHSLGEYSAHVAAGTIGLGDAVATVRRRGRYMQEAVPVGVGAMAAILGADLDTVFAQRANLLRPRFWKLLRDILRFNRLATELALGGESFTHGLLGLG